MAFAGLVMWFVEQCKSIVRRAESGKGAMALVCCVLKCLIMMCLNYLEFLCKMSVVMIGITGKPFTSAGSDVVNLFTSSFGDMALSTTVWVFPARIIGFFAFLLSVVAGGISGAFTYLAVKGLKDQPQGSDAADNATTYGVGVGVASWFIVWYLLIFFGHVLLNVVDTVFLCFMMDKKKGIVTKPEIHGVLNTLVSRHFTKQGKSVPQSFGGSVQVITTTTTTTNQVSQQPTGGMYPNIDQSAPPPQYSQQPGGCAGCIQARQAGLKFCATCGSNVM